MAMPITFCTIDGCSKRNHAKGMCVAHYTRFLRHGDPHTRLRAANGECVEWLEAHASFSEDECLDWPFAKCGGRGYVEFRGGMTTAGRAMCILAHGAPPSPEYEAAHSCGKGHEGCVSPKHLRWATAKDNHADKLVHGTQTRGENHPVAKLTERDVERILTRQEAPMPLALDLGVSRAMIHRIRKGQAWAHLQKQMEG